MLPPYAKAIVEARTAGIHPAFVTLVYGSAWCDRLYPRFPRPVMVLADEFLARRYDWWWLRGVPVVLINHDRERAEFIQLVATVARLTAPVYVNDATGVEGCDASDYLWCAWVDEGGERPADWSPTCEQEYAARLTRWEAATV